MARKWWTLTAVCAGLFMLLLDITIVNVALPDIGHAFGASLSDLQWVLDAYALTLAAFLLTAGSLADLFGRRLLFTIGTVIFTAGSLLCGVANDSLFLSVSRAGQGIGGAIMFATALALLAQSFRGKDRGVAFGAFGAVSGIAVAVGPALGGIITSGLSWRWIFFVNIPIGVAVVAIILLRVDESRDPHAGRPDFAGFLTFSGALAALVFGLIRSTADGWTSGPVLGSLAAAAALLVAFVVVESVQRRPMFDFALLRKPTFTGGIITAFALSSAAFSLITYLVLYLQYMLGYSAVDTGVRLLVLSGAMFATAGIAGRLTSVVPTRWLIVPGLAVIGAGILLMRGLTTASDWTHLIPGMIVTGLGAGLVNVPLASTAVGVVRPERAGMASGINSTFRQVGIATGIAVFGSIFSDRLKHSITGSLAHTPLAPHAPAIATAVANGETGQAVASAPPGRLRATVGLAARTGFVTALNDILLIAGITAFVAAAVCLPLIRQRDFVDATPQAAPPPAPVASGAPTGS